MKKKEPLTFEQIFQILKKFWQNEGCLIGEPYGLEVGAGTANPHTYFRVLGPEPWKAVYVEPTRRPDDSRYGENPNRLQHFFQFQIILKPIPKDHFKLYVESLAALGIDTKKHDLRFVEDNWESPSVGAWGVGWEVWLDGMEISQYTYFQQVGGVDLDPVSLEITYGPERIAMYMQDKDGYKKVKWNDKLTYGDIFERQEYWQSKYNLETATVSNVRKLFDIHYEEAQEQLELGNYLASYDSLLKMSHSFNILDSRGAVGVSERANAFRKMQHLSAGIVQFYLDERKALNYPLMKSK